MQNIPSARSLSVINPADTEWDSLPLFLREKQVRSDVFPVSHGALWDWVAKGTFPTPIKLSSGVTAWKRSDLMAWAEGTWLRGAA